MKITVSEPTFKQIRSLIPCVRERLNSRLRATDKMNIYFIDTGASDEPRS